MSTLWLGLESLCSGKGVEGGRVLPPPPLLAVHFLSWVSETPPADPEGSLPAVTASWSHLRGRQHSSSIDWFLVSSEIRDWAVSITVLSRVSLKNGMIPPLISEQDILIFLFEMTKSTVLSFRTLTKSSQPDKWSYHENEHIYKNPMTAHNLGLSMHWGLSWLNNLHYCTGWT